jgi:hypothetical protein
LKPEDVVGDDPLAEFPENPALSVVMNGSEYLNQNAQKYVYAQQEQPVQRPFVGGQSVQGQFSHPAGGQVVQGQFSQPIGGQAVQRQFSQPIGGQVVQGQFLQPAGGQSVQGQFSQPRGGQAVQGQFSQPVGGQVVQGQFSQPIGGQSVQGQFSQPAGGQVVQGQFSQPIGGQVVQGQFSQPIGGQSVQGQFAQPIGGQSEVRSNVNPTFQNARNHPEEDVVEVPYDIPKEKTIYFKIVLDQTLSMAKIYKHVYRKLEKLIVSLDKKVSRVQKCGQVGLLWGLTLITENKPETIRFDGKIFTPSAEKIKNALQTIVFHGGSDDGYEEINAAVKQAIQEMSDESAGEGNRGLLLLTDSIPYEEDSEPNFTYGAEHTGLRFAQCFVYDCAQYAPRFKMENGAGNPDVEGIQNLEIRDIEEYLKDDDIIVIDLLKEILDRTSTGIQM